MVRKNSTAKGNTARWQLIKMLEEDGWRVAIVERVGRFVSPRDAFGLFDLIGVKLGHVLFVQCTSNKPHNHKELEDFAAILPDQVWVEQWVRHDGAGQKAVRWKRYIYNDAGHTTHDIGGEQQ